MKYYITCVQKRVSPYGIYEDEERLRELIVCKDCALWDDADSEHLVGYCTEGDGEKITFRNEWCCWAERKSE